MKAKSKIQSIPVDIQEDLLAVGLLRRRLHELLSAVERRQDRIIGQLLGMRVDNALLSDLFRLHNERAARIRAAKAVRA